VTEDNEDDDLANSDDETEEVPGADSGPPTTPTVFPPTIAPGPPGGIVSITPLPATAHAMKRPTDSTSTGADDVATTKREVEVNVAPLPSTAPLSSAAKSTTSDAVPAARPGSGRDSQVGFPP